MSRSVLVDYEALRERQARIQEPGPMHTHEDEDD
jgi:hypothetical protein